MPALELGDLSRPAIAGLIGAALLLVSMVLPWFTLAGVDGGVGGLAQDAGALPDSTEGPGAGASFLLVALSAVSATAALRPAALGDRDPRGLLVGAGLAGIVVSMARLVMSTDDLVPGGEAVEAGLSLLAGVEVHGGSGVLVAFCGSVLVLIAGMAMPGGRLAAGAPLRDGLTRAWADRDLLALAGVGTGVTVTGCMVVGMTNMSETLLSVGFLGAIVSVVLARLTRRRARRSEDQQMLAVGRVGQVLGWILLGLMMVALAIVMAAVGQVAQDVNSISNGMEGF